MLMHTRAIFIIIIILQFFMQDTQHHADSRKDATMPNLIWNDEFNGPTGAPPDVLKWTANIGGDGWGNQELEYYTDNKNAYQDGQGHLVVEARQESPAGLQCWNGPCKYTSARLTTADRMSFTHGRVEARIKIPYGQGLWPAFWLLGSNCGPVEWPACGELDIMENIGKEPNIIHATMHGQGYSGGNGISGTYTMANGHYSDNYHIYAIEWDSNHAAFFVDGANYLNVTRAQVEAKGQWVFDHAFNVVLNIAVGGGWSGNPDGNTVFPQKMYVDYVRLFQLG